MAEPSGGESAAGIAQNAVVPSSSSEHVVPFSVIHPPFDGSSADWDVDMASCFKQMQKQMIEMEKQMERLSERFFHARPRPASAVETSRTPLSSWMHDDFFDADSSMFSRRPASMLRDAHAKWFSEDFGDDRALTSSGDCRQVSQSEQRLCESGAKLPAAPLTPHPSLSNIAQESLIAPVTVNDGGRQKMRYRFDVRQYKPEEIIVKTLDNRLSVHAVHKEESEAGKVYQEYQRTFTLPDGVPPDTLESSLSHDGVLTIDAPLPTAQTQKDIMIPIIHEAS